jgi:putative oxidoreductase
MPALVETIRPVILLIARIAVGVVFAAHGVQKFFLNGLEGTGAFFASVGVPAPELLATAAAVAELVGGVLIILGLLLPVAGVVLAVDLLGAFWFVHRVNGFWFTDSGYEWVIALGIALLLVTFSEGPLSLDRYLSRGRATTGARR